MLKDINLLPDKILYRKQKIFKSSIRIFLIVFGIAGIIFAAMYLPYQRITLEKKLTQASVKINNGALNELNKAEEELLTLTKQKRELDIAYKQVPQVTMKTTDILKRISSLMTTGITATSLNYREESKTLTLNINARTRNDISLFLKQLYDQEYLSDISISSISGREGIYNTTISAKFTP